MAKAKKMLSAVLAALMVVLSVASYVPAQAAKAVNVPKLQMVTQPEKEYKNGDRVSLTVTSPNYGGQVEYRVILWNGTTKKQSELWPTHKGYYYQNWKPAGSYKFTIHWPVEGMEPGAYSLTVLTRRANSKVSYDSFVKTEAFWVKNELAVDSIAALEDVTVDEGAEAKLPAEVTLNMTDKTTKTAKVTWEAVDTAKPGEYTVNGTVEGTDKKATVKVIVKEVALKVESVSAITAKSFNVVFNKAVTDTAKVKFEVKRANTPVTVTTTWDEAKKVATLASAGKLAEGEYEVIVSDTSSEKPVVLTTSKITIEKEKITAVEFDSETLIRYTDTEGYVGFKVKNQYNEDVTDSALGRGLTFNVSTDNPTPTVNYKGHIITVKHDAAVTNKLRDLKTVVITARDITSGFATSATLAVSSNVSAISDIKLNGIVDENGKSVDFVYGSGKTYYLDFTATDANGKEIKNYDVLNSTNNTLPVLTITCTNTTNIVTNSSSSLSISNHPERNTDGAYRLDFTGTAPQFDTPVTFIATAPFSGKSSTLTVTLKKSASVDTFTMLAPAEIVSVGKSVEIPFEAYDQNGVKVTKYSDLALGQITLSCPANMNLTWVRQSDGSAKLYAMATTKGIYYITSTVTNSTKASFSQISIDVKDAAVPTKISAYRMTQGLSNGAVKTYIRISNFDIRDKYDNKMNLRVDPNNSGYYVKVGTSNPNIVTVAGGEAITGQNAVKIYGDLMLKFIGGSEPGTATITYTLCKADGTTVDTASTILYNIDEDDIVSAKIDLAKDTELFMTQKDNRYTNIASGITADGDITQWPGMLGISKTGMEVLLADDKIVAYSVNDQRFVATTDAGLTASGNFGTQTAANATITGLVKTGNGVYSDSTTIKASSAMPIASDIYIEANNALRRLAVENGGLSVVNDVYTLSAATLQGADFNGKSIIKYLSTNGVATDAAKIKFNVDTQYGWNTGLVSNVITVKNSGDGTLTIDSITGVINSTGVKTNDVYTITAVSGNATKTIVIKVK